MVGETVNSIGQTRLSAARYSRHGEWVAVTHGGDLDMNSESFIFDSGSVGCGFCKGRAGEIIHPQKTSRWDLQLQFLTRTLAQKMSRVRNAILIAVILFDVRPDQD